MPNFTLDDTDPTLAFSPAWATQLPSDPDLDHFFDRTYHAAQADGATMTFQFNGFAFALYGSKGPGHAKFQVQFDSTVLTLDAAQPQTAFHQQLFAHAFGNGSESATHLVKLTAVLSGDGIQGRWLDIDYITFASAPDSQWTSSIGTVTSSPPWLTGSSQTSTLSSTASLTPFRSTSTPPPSPSKTPTILAATFGALIGLALVLGAFYLLLRRVYDRSRARERVFRYGQSSANPSLGGAPSTFGGSSHKSGAGAFSPSTGSGILKDLPGVPRDPSQRSAPYASLPHTHAHAHRAGEGNGSLASSRAEMRMASAAGGGGGGGGSGGREGAGTPTGTGASSVTRPLLSASPIAWGRQKHKGDADSLRTDFLQV